MAILSLVVLLRDDNRRPSTRRGQGGRRYVSVEIIKKLIVDSPEAMLAWDQAVRGEQGGKREGAGRPPKAPKEIKLYNIQPEKEPQESAPTGTSAQAGLRRLDKAAQAGDMLRRISAPCRAAGSRPALAHRVPPTLRASAVLDSRRLKS
jgi:hypothetical protein